MEKHISADGWASFHKCVYSMYGFYMMAANSPRYIISTLQSDGNGDALTVSPELAGRGKSYSSAPRSYCCSGSWGDTKTQAVNTEQEDLHTNPHLYSQQQIYTARNLPFVVRMETTKLLQQHFLWKLTPWRFIKALYLHVCICRHFYSKQLALYWRWTFNYLLFDYSFCYRNTMRN